MSVSRATTLPTLTSGDAALCKPGTMFELETVNINGRPTTVWKNVRPLPSPC